MKDAVNIPLTSEKFADRVRALRKQTTRRIVFYCNGHASHNPYLAARAAMHAGVKNVFAYDAGIDEWAVAYPQKVVLAGKVSANSYPLQLARQY
jgi:rhodanese-related sulfurtransferase